jgi:hypothetical protein
MLSWIYGAPKVGRKYGWNVNETLTEDELVKFTYKVLNYHSNLENVKVIDNSAFLPPVFDQGQLGSCTANSIIGLYEYTEKKINGSYIPMSRLGLYYMERVEDGGNVSEDTGAQIKTGVNITHDKGVGLESLCPYDISKFAEKPSDMFYDDLQYHKAIKIQRVKKTLKDIDQCLLDGHCISMGFKVYSSFETDEVAKTGIVPVPNTSKEQLLGGHAVLLHSKIVVKGKIKYVIRNSWGEGWGCNNTGGTDGVRGNFLVDPEFLVQSSGIFGLNDLCSDFWTTTIVRDQPDSNVIETDAQKLENVKKILGVDSSVNDLEKLFDKIRSLIVNVEAQKPKTA